MLASANSLSELISVLTAVVIGGGVAVLTTTWWAMWKSKKQTDKLVSEATRQAVAAVGEMLRRDGLDGTR